MAAATTEGQFMAAFLLISSLLVQAFANQARNGVVTGQITSRDGQSVTGIRISAMAIPEGNVPTTTASTLVSFVLTDSAGRYRLENIPAGRYYIIAGLVELPTYYPGVSSLSGAILTSTVIREPSGRSTITSRSRTGLPVRKTSAIAHPACERGSPSI